jgi:hypothetical protein
VLAARFARGAALHPSEGGYPPRSKKRKVRARVTTSGIRRPCPGFRFLLCASVPPAAPAPWRAPVPARLSAWAVASVGPRARGRHAARAPLFFGSAAPCAMAELFT